MTVTSTVWRGSPGPVLAVVLVLQWPAQGPHRETVTVSVTARRPQSAQFVALNGAQKLLAQCSHIARTLLAQCLAQSPFFAQKLLAHCSRTFPAKKKQGQHE
eukprot:3590502-Rhodomonas_salina.1